MPRPRASREPRAPPRPEPPTAARRRATWWTPSSRIWERRNRAAPVRAAIGGARGLRDRAGPAHDHAGLLRSTRGGGRCDGGADPPRLPALGAPLFPRRELLGA